MRGFKRWEYLLLATAPFLLAFAVSEVGVPKVFQVGSCEHKRSEMQRAEMMLAKYKVRGRDFFNCVEQSPIEEGWTLVEGLLRDRLESKANAAALSLRGVGRLRARTVASKGALYHAAAQNRHLVLWMSLTLSVRSHGDQRRCCKAHSDREIIYHRLSGALCVRDVLAAMQVQYRGSDAPALWDLRDMVLERSHEHYSAGIGAAVIGRKRTPA